MPGTRLLMLPGPTTLYWFGSTLLEAGPPPFPVDSLELDPVMEIPRSAVESVPGIRYLLDTIPTLPESLSKRVTRIQPKRVLRVRTEPTEWGELSSLFRSWSIHMMERRSKLLAVVWLVSLRETRCPGRRPLRSLST